jgi:hypothetical protein
LTYHNIAILYLWRINSSRHFHPKNTDVGTASNWYLPGYRIFNITKTNPFLDIGYNFLLSIVTEAEKPLNYNFHFFKIKIDFWELILLFPLVLSWLFYPHWISVIFIVSFQNFKGNFYNGTAISSLSKLLWWLCGSSLMQTIIDLHCSFNLKTQEIATNFLFSMSTIQNLWYLAIIILASRQIIHLKQMLAVCCPCGLAKEIVLFFLNARKVP